MRANSASASASTCLQENEDAARSQLLQRLEGSPPHHRNLYPRRWHQSAVEPTSGLIRPEAHCIIMELSASGCRQARMDCLQPAPVTTRPRAECITSIKVGASNLDGAGGANDVEQAVGTMQLCRVTAKEDECNGMETNHVQDEHVATPRRDHIDVR